MYPTTLHKDGLGEESTEQNQEGKFRANQKPRASAGPWQLYHKECIVFRKLKLRPKLIEASLMHKHPDPFHHHALLQPHDRHLGR